MSTGESIKFCQLRNGKIMQYDVRTDSSKITTQDRDQFVYLGIGHVYSIGGIMQPPKPNINHFWIQKGN